MLFLRGGHIERVGHRDSMQWAVASAETSGVLNLKPRPCLVALSGGDLVSLARGSIDAMGLRAAPLLGIRAVAYSSG